MGANTTTSHRVIATAASPISILPRTAAVRASSPRWMCLSTFSRMTMESSTRMPMHRPSAIRETMFSVKWKSHIAKNVPTRETGMATRTISEERHRRRNRKSTSAVVMMLSTRFSRVSSRDELMNFVASLATVREVPGRSVGCSSTSSLFTRLAVSTTFASLCLRTMIPMEACVFSRTALLGVG